MKFSLTVILNGIGGTVQDANPAPVEDVVVVQEQPEPDVIEVEVIVNNPNVAEEPDPVDVYVPPTPIIIEPTPDPVVVVDPVVPDPVEPDPDPVVVVTPPVVVVPTTDDRTIHDLPTLSVLNPQLFVTFAGRNNDSNYSASEADAEFGFKWQSFDAKKSEILNGKWNVTVPANEIKKGIHAVKYLTPASELYFGYEIEFDENYDLADNHGGKLPGLIGLNTDLRKSGGGQVYPDGCSSLGQRRDEGFSLRSMFRKDGRMIGYFYHEDNPEMYPGGNNSCGHEVDYMHEGQKFYVQKGKKYFIETRCKLNSKNAGNGIVEVWVNGFKVISMTNMRLSHSLLYKINAAFIYFWHGGSSSTWEPSNDSTVRFDNFIIQSTPISH